MKILFSGSQDAIVFLQSLSANIEWISNIPLSEWQNSSNADAYFNFDENAAQADYSFTNKPVFINSVVDTLSSYGHKDNVVRINGWNGFFQREKWEIAGQITTQHEVILKEINRSFIVTPDEPGFISSRILSMIINEAYFAKEQQVSTEEEIDTAMKLGTNYPKGPFEWKKEIGAANVLRLLEVLSKTDERYHPSDLLKKEAAI